MLVLCLNLFLSFLTLRSRAARKSGGDTSPATVGAAQAHSFVSPSIPSFEKERAYAVQLAAETSAHVHSLTSSYMLYDSLSLSLAWC